MRAGDTQIPYDAQCPHASYYDCCMVCSGAKADFERAMYLLADEWPEDWCHDIRSER